METCDGDWNTGTPPLCRETHPGASPALRVKKALSENLRAVWFLATGSGIDRRSRDLRRNNRIYAPQGDFRR